MGTVTNGDERVLERIWRSMKARWRHERGQMLMIFALLVVPVTFILGAVAVDASVWQSERRGAQKDADLSALSGALQLAFEQNKANAESATMNAANTNDEAGNAPGLTPGDDDSVANSVVVDDACFPGNTALPLNSVSVNLNHNSQTFFSSIFGIDVAPDIGAHARACVGSLTNPNGLRPWALDKETSPCFGQTAGPNFKKPLFGQECVFDWGSKGSPGTGDRGLLILETTAGPCSSKGNASVEQVIEQGGQGSCFTNSGNTCTTPLSNCVEDKSGNVSGPVSKGIDTLFADANDCDTNGNGRDDFTESLELLGGGSAPPSPNNVYTPVTCADGKISERIITIIAVDSIDKKTHKPPWPIRYFLQIFITGCRDSRDGPNGPLDPNCAGQNGNTRYYGILFQAHLLEAGDITAPNDSGTRVVTLDQ
jgi:hypothetical protein